MLSSTNNSVQIFSFVYAQQILLRITNNSTEDQSFVYTQLIDQTVLFSICTSFKCQTDNWTIDLTLFGAFTLSQNGPENDGNEGVLWIPQTSGITIRLFNVISGHSLGVGVLPPLQACNLYFLLPQPTGLPVLFNLVTSVYSFLSIKRYVFRCSCPFPFISSKVRFIKSAYLKKGVIKN